MVGSVQYRPTKPDFTKAYERPTVNIRNQSLDKSPSEQWMSSQMRSPDSTSSKLKIQFLNPLYYFV